jgi:ferredoxin/flavodoxin
MEFLSRKAGQKTPCPIGKTSYNKEEVMSLIRLLLGRRQFLGALLGSTLTLAFGRFAKAFNFIFQTDSARASEKPATAQKKALKGIVAYYSGTGNTAQIAEAVYKGMKSVIPCDVAPINKLDPKKMDKYDLVAIGAPNWYMRVPANVLVFTHDMPQMNGKHCFLFGTHGSGGPGMFWNMSRNILKRNMTIIGWGDWYGSDFLTPHSCVPDGEWGHPDLVDLAEAEAFGRRMALNSIRIYNGETGLLPDEIPRPDIGGDSLFSPSGNGGKIGFAGGAANATPRFDFTKCVYPRCTRCIDNCIVQAIDFSLLTTANSVLDRSSTASPLVLKEACQRCGGLCERVCLYGAIAYIGDKGVRVFQNIDMTKCTYPKCTECMDLCPQKAIDVSKNPPVVYSWCENESLCYGVCPENAIDFTPTSMHIDEGSGGRGITVQGEGRGEMGQGQAGMPGGEGGRGAMGQGQAPMPGGPGGAEGSAPPMGGGMGGYSPRFRNLLKGEECTIGKVVELTKYPRIPINKKLWPYHVEQG